MAYISTKDVEIRLLGKVRFSDDDEDANKFPRTLLSRLIKEAEGKVERDLSPRYAAPFRGTAGEAFKTLPSTTQEAIRTMCELMAVVRVIGNDFGRGTVNDGSAFKKEQETLYKEMLERELEQRVEGGAVAQWKFPPLAGLATADFNMADDGFAGAVLTTSDDNGEGTFPQKQITDPSENWSNGDIDP